MAPHHRCAAANAGRGNELTRGEQTKKERALAVHSVRRLPERPGGRIRCDRKTRPRECGKVVGGVPSRPMRDYASREADPSASADRACWLREVSAGSAIVGTSDVLSRRASSKAPRPTSPVREESFVSIHASLLCLYYTPRVKGAG